MPSETSFSFVRSISEVTSIRRAESGRPESDGENVRSETFGALVSEAAQTRNAERRNVPPVETPQEPVDPRPAPERRPVPEARADRANPRRSEEGDAHCNDDKAPPTVAKTEKTTKTETAGSADEASTSGGGGTEEKVEDEAGTVAEAAAEAIAAEPVKAEPAPIAPVAVVAGTVESVPGETIPTAIGGDPTAVGGIDKTGGTALPEPETPVPVAEAAVSETAAPVVAKSEAGKTASTDGATETNAATTSVTEAGETVATELIASKTVVNAKEGGSAKAETALEKIKAETAEGENEAGEGKPAETGKKATTPDLNPTRLNRVADMLESFGLSHAIHRPADILAGLDRAVQASAVNGAMNRTADIARPTPLQMLPIEIGMQAVRGVTNFQIRLDPAELGRVDVKLQIRDNGEVNASLVVDRVETLAMLKRDASTLQQAFEQAGLRQSADGLSFSLRGDGQNGEARRDGSRGPTGENADDNSLQPQVAEMAMRRAYVPNSNLDLMI